MGKGLLLLFYYSFRMQEIFTKPIWETGTLNNCTASNGRACKIISLRGHPQISTTYPYRKSEFSLNEQQQFLKKLLTDINFYVKTSHLCEKIILVDCVRHWLDYLLVPPSMQAPSHMRLCAVMRKVNLRIHMNSLSWITSSQDLSMNSTFHHKKTVIW